MSVTSRARALCILNLTLAPGVSDDIPPSVLGRLENRGCRTVGEAEVTVKVAGQAVGPRLAVFASLNSYVIPVQCSVDFEIEDIIWYCLVGSASNGADLRSLRGSRLYCWLNGEASAPFSRFEESKMAAARILSEDYTSPSIGRWGALDPSEDWWAADSARAWWSGRAELDVYPTKKLGYDHKINLWFKDVWHDCRLYRPDLAHLWASREELSVGMFNDEATGWLIWLSSLPKPLLAVGSALVHCFSRDNKGLKLISTVLKSVGAQARDWGPLFCELEVLAGRGVKIPKPWDDVRTRVNRGEFLARKGVELDRDKLERCIRNVVRRESTVTPQWGDVNEYWSRRWAFTKSGSHSRYPEERWFGCRLDLPPLPTRREFSEAVEHNVVALGEPRVDAGYSMKLEHGKTRAIYGCDSVSYFTFDYLLGPIEAVWKNHRTLLDPGRQPQSVLYRRLRRHAGIKYMVDFDDFNSQHTLEALKLCIEVTCEHAPRAVRDWAIASWDNMFVHWPSEDGLREARMVGTLPSGHRATTFVNTILNAAYCEYALGDTYRNITSYHVGDDVFMSGHDSDISAAVSLMTASPFRVNPAKQSVGSVLGEFLRVAFTQSSAVGYCARAISSLVSGSWVAETQVDRRSYLENAVRSWWTISSRAGGVPLGALGVSSLQRWLPEVSGRAYEILMHRLSVDGSPVLSRTAGTGVTVIRLTGGTQRRVYLPPKHTYASDAYMSNHVDVGLLEAAGVPKSRLYSMLLEASYRPIRRAEGARVEIIWDRAFAWCDFAMRDLLMLYEREGKSNSEAYQLLRAIYKDVDWRTIIAGLRGVDTSSMSTSGECQWPVLNAYEMPFSDAMRFRKRITTCTAVYTTYPVRV